MNNRRYTIRLLLLCAAVLLGGCASNNVPNIPDKSPCTGYIKAGGTNPCVVVPINPTTT